MTLIKQKKLWTQKKGIKNVDNLNNTSEKNKTIESENTTKDKVQRKDSDSGGKLSDDSSEKQNLKTNEKEDQMNLIVGLIAITLFYILFADIIKKYPVLFYMATYVLIIPVVLYYQTKFYKNMPIWFTRYVMDIFQRGIFSTVTFMIVMFLGVITTHNKYTRKLMSIRGEMSIIGCFAALCHNVAFGIRYFVEFFTNASKMNVYTKTATIISLILIAMMIPLMITSFKCVRKKMKAKNWKNLQKLAYPFFYLIYVHLMVLFMHKPEKHMLSIVLYTVIYMLYTVLRIRKCLITKKRQR